MSETDKENLVNDSDNSEEDAQSNYSKSDEESSETDSEDEDIITVNEEDLEEEEADIEAEGPSIEPSVGGAPTNVTVSETPVIAQQELSNAIPVDEINYTSESDEEYDEDYLQKFDDELKRDYLVDCHPEEVADNYDQIAAMSKITRNKNGIVIDALHKTLPILTKYEYTNVLGLRAKQINAGAKIFVKADNIIDGYIIAQMEIRKKKLPFIIRRPIPNGGSEYWKLKDLEILI